MFSLDSEDRKLGAQSSSDNDHANLVERVRILEAERAEIERVYTAEWLQHKTGLEKKKLETQNYIQSLHDRNDRLELLCTKLAEARAHADARVHHVHEQLLDQEDECLELQGRVAELQQLVAGGERFVFGFKYFKPFRQIFQCIRHFLSPSVWLRFGW